MKRVSNMVYQEYPNSPRVALTCMGFSITGWEHSLCVCSQDLKSNSPVLLSVLKTEKSLSAKLVGKLFDCWHSVTFISTQVLSPHVHLLHAKGTNQPTLVWRCYRFGWSAHSSPTHSASLSRTNTSYVCFGFFLHINDWMHWLWTPCSGYIFHSVPISYLNDWLFCLFAFIKVYSPYNCDCVLYHSNLQGSLNQSCVKYYLQFF